MHWTTSRLFLSPEENQGHVNVVANMKASIIYITYQYTGCSLDIRDERILCLLSRILWLTFGSQHLFFIQTGVEPESKYSPLMLHLLRANVGKYRESQISSKNSNFGWYHPNIPLGELFQEMILRNPQALYILRILEKFENLQKIHFLIQKMGANFNRFQRNSTSAPKLLLTWYCSCI